MERVKKLQTAYLLTLFWIALIFFLGTIITKAQVIMTANVEENQMNMLLERLKNCESK